MEETPAQLNARIAQRQAALDELLTERDRRIGAAYAAGTNLEPLAEEWQLSLATIRAARDRAGVPARPKGRRPKPKPESDPVADDPTSTQET